MIDTIQTVGLLVTAVSVAFVAVIGVMRSFSVCK